MHCMFTVLNTLTLNAASSFRNIMSNESDIPVQKHKHHMVSLTGRIKKETIEFMQSQRKMQAVRRCWSQCQISVRQEECVLRILHSKGSTTDNYHFKIVSVPQVALQSFTSCCQRGKGMGSPT